MQRSTFRAYSINSSARGEKGSVDGEAERLRHGLESAPEPDPEVMAGSQTTTTRVTLGAISLSSSSHFAPMP
jgi:hypothetical protein